MSADTDTLLALARDCGANVELGIEVGPEKVYFVEMAVDQLAALEQRIRADERERAARICEQRAALNVKARGQLDGSELIALVILDGRVAEADSCAAALRSSASEGGQTNG